jgi:AraC-like DNA-binding protein
MNDEKKLKKHTLIAIASVIAFIDNEPMNNKTTADFAAEYRINRKLLQQGFKAIKGMGIKEYHNLKRMEACKVMLKDGDFSVKQIAGICLYKSQRAFTNAFKKLYAITPTEYQHQVT